MSVADDIVVLNTGEVAYAGSAEDVRATPDLATRHLGVF
ncbi:MAG: ABC transporter ATP-binding protein, partial [Polynucleobacter sp.]|jgi:branched-chain amino acid transport system ATP-binding protein|nr:ABC transporter ATP-binding protein [Polynucleobacter sp.]